jgi:hypothetical protein
MRKIARHIAAKEDPDREESIICVGERANFHDAHTQVSAFLTFGASGYQYIDGDGLFLMSSGTVTAPRT